MNVIGSNLFHCNTTADVYIWYVYSVLENHSDHEISLLTALHISWLLCHTTCHTITVKNKDTVDTASVVSNVRFAKFCSSEHIINLGTKGPLGLRCNSVVASGRTFFQSKTMCHLNVKCKLWLWLYNMPLQNTVAKQFTINLIYIMKQGTTSTSTWQT